MSLINQMLKDLEKRSKPLAVPNYFVSGLRSKSPNVLQYKKQIMILTAILFIGFFLLYQFNHKISSNQPVKVVTTGIPENIVLSNGSADIVSTPLHLSPTTLTGIALEVQNDLTDLRLLLSQNTLYHVKRDEKQRLVIILEQTQLVANVPSFVNNMESAIEDVEMTNQTDGNLQMVFTLKEGAELSHLNLNVSGKLPELQMIFQYKPPRILGTEQQRTLSEPIVLQKNEGSVKKLRYDLSLDEAYQHALKLSRDNKINEAIATLNNILNQNPEFTPARETVASLLLKKGEIEQVQQVIKTGLTLQPNYPPYIKLKAEMMVQQGKISDALKLLLMSPPEIQEDTEYYALVAALYQQNDQYQLAKEIYEKLLTLRPNNSTWWVGLGVSLESIGERGQALDAFQMASRDTNLQSEIKDYIETRLSALQ